MRIFLFIITSLLACCRLTAQPAPPAEVYVDKVSIEGNKKTRPEIILRELLFSEGDTISLPQLGEVLERSEQLVLNTGLFNDASIVFKDWEGSTNRVHISIKVEETWYLYPVPVFELADRNFNVWWVEQGASLKRVNYGLDFTHLNMSGRRDKLSIGLRYGYTRNYRINYSLPYINAKQTLGFVSEISFSRNKEVNYATKDSKQAFYRDEDGFLYQRLRAEAGLSVRPGLRTNHLFVAGFRQNMVDEIVPGELNPDFFMEGRKLQRYFSLAYRYTFENRDVVFYPWKGDYFAFALSKDGIGIYDDRNALTVRARYDRHLPFSQRFSLGMSLRGKLSLIRSQQPYNDNRAMGFMGNTIRGFEYYIVDGLDLGLLKTSLHWKILSTRFNFGKLMPIKAFRSMPLKLFLALNNDVGIVNDPFLEASHFLSNRPMWGGGLGLNFLLFYDKVLRIEYSLNDLGEHGLFLHINMNI